MFGSFVDPAKPDVGDLDIVVERKRRPKFDKMPWRDVAKHIDKVYPGVVAESLDPIDADEHFLKRMIYGVKRHPLVSPCRLDILIDMHTPCRLVFDSERGGRIPPEEFDHHPKSKGRGEGIRDRLVMPDLKSIPPVFELTPAEVVSERFGVVLRGGGKFPVILVVERALREEASAWFYDSRVTAHASTDLPFSLDPSELKRAADRIGNLFNADILRLADRRDRLHVYHDISASMEMVGRHRVEVSRALRPMISELGSYSEKVSVSPRHEFGLEIEVDGQPAEGFAPILSYDDGDWKEFGKSLPFDRERYDEWLAEADPVRHAEMRAFYDSPMPGI